MTDFVAAMSLDGLCAAIMGAIAKPDASHAHAMSMRH